MWLELWWAMAGGKKTEYERIKATPVFEFWKIYDLWKEGIKRESDALKASQRKR